MASEQVPDGIQDKRLIRLELAGILGSQASPEQALVNIFREAAHSGNIIFALDDVQQLAKATGSEGLSVLEVLVNLLENSPILVIATTTPEDYQTTLRNSANFDERFVTYELQDLNEQGVMLASCMRASQLEGGTGAFFQYQAVQEAVNLTNEYFKDTGQPQKAISVLQEAANRVKSLPKGPQKLITPKVIQEVVAEKTHVPTSTFTQGEADKLLHLEEEIGRRVIGQKEAVVAVSEGMRRARSGLSSGQRPMASFLFVGPTGVGKTELAKTLAQVYFGDERYMLRLDMSEYRGDDGMRKLVGAPGQQVSTPFVTHLKTYPFCLFLLDELEKASPDVLNLFLAVLEDGRITTASGQTLDLTHTIIIATSNAGTPEIQAGIKEGRAMDSIKSELLEKILVNYYRPEFLNRFDAVILFKPLVPDEVVEITRLQLAAVTKNLLQKKIKLGFSEAALHKVATEAFDPLLGGRPIRRYIQDHVESVIAKLLLSKQLERGGDVTIDLNEAGEFISK
jgi:ATP-dependent Clp protease ATP-binding subunit ClpC